MIQLARVRVQKSKKTILCVDELKVKTGEKIVIDGANGSGKTTLLKLLAHLESDYQGSFACSNALQEITYVHQEPVCFRGNVAHNVFYGLKARGIPFEESTKRVHQWTNNLGLGGLLNQDAQTLSGGEKKKVAIVRALVFQPKLLLLDEPLAELDDSTAHILLENLLKLKSTTIIATTPHWDKRYNEFRRVQMNELVN